MLKWCKQKYLDQAQKIILLKQKIKELETNKLKVHSNSHANEGLSVEWFRSKIDSRATHQYTATLEGAND